MNLFLSQYEFILIDFEFRPRDGIEGNPVEVICMVALNLRTGEYIRLWADDLYAITEHPFPNQHNTVFVAYFASAEMSCFQALGWSWPHRILDLYAEFRNLTNGIPLEFGKSLLGAMQYFSLPCIGSITKDDMRDLALRGGPYTDTEKLALLDYCQSDVDALQQLLLAMQDRINLPLAFVRGQYSVPLAVMEGRGTPIDYELYLDLCANWEAIKTELIAQIDVSYGVYQNGTFKESLFEEYLRQKGICWPRLETGRLKLDEDTFKELSNTYPELKPLRQLRDSLSKLRLNALQVGNDGRNRCLLSPFSSITGRNQPSTNKFIFGVAKWVRGLIQPKPGLALAYIDWSQQEFGIAAALSNDDNMKAAYLSGDPYLAFAKQANAVPEDATKKSHPAVRDQYKQCVLATQYGMGADTLALQLNAHVLTARKLLAIHRRVYWQFWNWSDNVFNHTIINNRIATVFGWQLNIQPIFNARSLRNFPMQANAAEMLRIACLLIAEHGIQLCAPVHDAILIEAPEHLIEEHVQIAQNCMVKASRIVLSGFTLASDAQILRYPERFLDEQSQPFWETVMEIMRSVKNQKMKILTPTC
jgi:DNA polymerase-1